MRKISKATSIFFALFLGLLGLGPWGCGSSGGGSASTALSVSQALAFALAGINSIAVVGGECPNGGSYTTSDENIVTYSNCAFENYVVNGSIHATEGAESFTSDLAVDSDAVGAFSVTGSGSAVMGEGSQSSLDETGTFGNTTGHLEASITGSSMEGIAQSGSVKVTSDGSTVLSCTLASGTSLAPLTCAALASACGVDSSNCQ